MEHQHSISGNINLGNAFKIGITINILFIIIEVFFGFFSNSMALISDAGHNLTDVLAMIFSWIAVILSKRKPTLKYTYGLRRITILIALINTIMLLAAIAFILLETIKRFGNPEEINSANIIIVASVGIVVNGFTAWLFIKGKKNDLNIRSTFVHFLSDALVSLGVVIAGVFILFTGFYWFDTLISLVIVAVILYSTYNLLIDTFKLELDAVPENINIQLVSDYLMNLPEVIGIHDLHIWALSTSESALTVHIKTNIQTDTTFISNIQHNLHEQYNIGHSTIQIEFGDKEIDCKTNCN